MNGSYIFYSSFHEAISDLPDEEYGKVMRVLNEFAINGVEPTGLKGTAKIVFALAKPLIEASLKNRKNGAKGGKSSIDSETSKPASENSSKDDSDDSKPALKEVPSPLKETSKPASENVASNVNVNVNDDVNGDGSMSIPSPAENAEDKETTTTFTTTNIAKRFNSLGYNYDYKAISSVYDKLRQNGLTDLDYIDYGLDCCRKKRFGGVPFTSKPFVEQQTLLLTSLNGPSVVEWSQFFTQWQKERKGKATQAETQSRIDTLKKQVPAKCPHCGAVLKVKDNEPYCEKCNKLWEFDTVSGWHEEDMAPVEGFKLLPFTKDVPKKEPPADIF